MGAAGSPIFRRPPLAFAPSCSLWSAERKAQACDPAARYSVRSAQSVRAFAERLRLTQRLGRGVLLSGLNRVFVHATSGILSEACHKSCVSNRSQKSLISDAGHAPCGRTRGWQAHGLDPRRGLLQKRWPRKAFRCVKGGRVTHIDKFWFSTGMWLSRRGSATGAIVPLPVRTFASRRARPR